MTAVQYLYLAADYKVTANGPPEIGIWRFVCRQIIKVLIYKLRLEGFYMLTFINMVTAVIWA